MPSSLLAQHRDVVGVEGHLELADELRERIVGRRQGAAQRGQGLGLGARPRRVGGSARRGGHEEAHHSADQEEDHQRDQVLALGDRELVVRRCEEPVREQEARDRAHERGDEPTERGDHHDDQEEHQQLARERERVAQVGQHEREQRRCEDRQRPRHDPAAWRQHGPPWPTRRGLDRIALGGVVAFGVGRDHVDVDVARRAEHVGDHRAAQQVRPARLPARPQHDLGRVLGPGELHQRRRRVGARELVVLAAELLQERPLHTECVTGGTPEAVGGPDVDPEELAAGARGHARRPADHVVTTRRAGDRDDDALTRLPRARDPVRSRGRRPALRRPGRRPT